MVGDTGMDIGSIGANWAYITNNPVQKADRASPQTEDMAQRLIQARDQDGSGALDGVELCLSREAFDWLDANRDSQLDTSELVEGAKKILREMGYATGTTRPTSIARENEQSEQAPLDLLFGADEDEEMGIDALL
jgi:hypothetical protein